MPSMPQAHQPDAPKSATVRSKFWRTTGIRAAIAKEAMKEEKKEVQESCSGGRTQLD